MGKKKKQQATSHPVHAYKLYEEGKRKNQFCPKCGMGVYMSRHEDRSHCGKCGYTEFKK